MRPDCERYLYAGLILFGVTILLLAYFINATSLYVFGGIIIVPVFCLICYDLYSCYMRAKHDAVPIAFPIVLSATSSAPIIVVFGTPIGDQ